MATMTMTATRREVGRKGPSRRLRGDGNIPAVLYGRGIDSLPLSVPAAEFHYLLRQRSGTLILELKLDNAGEDDRLAVIRDIQRDPVTGTILHLDLQRVSLKEKVQVQVPLHVMGISPGVKEDGGVLEHPLRHIEVKCLPHRIPERLDVDVSALRIGDNIHVRDLAIDRTELEVVTEPDMVVVTVSAPRILKTEAEVAAEAAAVATEAAVAEEGAEDKGGEKKGEKGEKGEERKGKEKGRDKD